VRLRRRRENSLKEFEIEEKKRETMKEEEKEIGFGLFVVSHT